MTARSSFEVVLPWGSRQQCVGCEPRAWGMPRRRIKVAMWVLRQDVIATGVGGIQGGVRGWSRVLGKGKLLLLAVEEQGLQEP